MEKNKRMSELETMTSFGFFRLDITHLNMELFIVE